MSISRNMIGPKLLWILALIPLVMWAGIEPLSERFRTPFDSLTSGGQIAGLLGMALFSLNFVLAARFSFLEPFFNGVNRMTVVHHRTGAYAFVLLLAHPLFLSLSYATVSLESAAVFLWDVTDLEVTLGKAALLAMSILLGITFFARWKYENWKRSHQWLGLAFFLGGLHAFLVPSDIAANAPLRAYMFALAALGLACYVYRTVFKLYRRLEHAYAVTRVNHAKGNVVALELAPRGKPLRFTPGQFIFIRFDAPGVRGEAHPFSITAAPGRGSLSLGVKALGDFTSRLQSLRPGVAAHIEGPFGVFTYLRAASKRQIWVAGGIGVTPFLGMARDLEAHARRDYDIDLYYSVRNEEEAAFLDELRGIASRNPNFRITLHDSSASGFLTAERVNVASPVSGKEVYLCGPPGFMKALREQFVTQGIPSRAIHTEEFAL